MIEAMEENIAHFYRDFAAASPHLDRYSGPDIVWVLSETGSAIVNALVRTRGTAADVPALIEAAVARAKARRVPLMWWVVPETNPPTLPDALLGRGFTRSGEMPGMVADLRPFSAASLPEGVRIERVSDAATATAWCEIARTSFALGPESEAFFYRMLMMSASDADARTQHFIGYLDAVPVATASLSTHDGVAGIYCVATLASARRRGIGAAMTRHAMQIAQAAGASAATLQASAAGESVYRQLGFVECCRVAQYLWTPDAP